jgi:FHA domain-containing protein
MEPVAGRTGSVLQPGENRLGVGSYIINFMLPGGESPRGGGAAGSAAPLPVQGPIGRGTWSVDLPDPPRGTARPGIRLNDLAESAGFLDLYVGDPTTHPNETELGVAQLTLADPLDTGGGRTERRPLGRLERTTAGWVLHPPRAREVTISRPDRANPNGPSTEIRVRRESPERLREGDIISFGPALEFEFRNGSLIPAVTGDLRGRLTVPDRSAGAAQDAMGLTRPPSVSPPPPVAEPVASPTIIDSYGQTMMVPLTQPGMLVLGRGGDVRIGAEDPTGTVSNRHATVRLVVEGGVSRYEIRDGAEIPTGWQASLNGTFVNGERVRPGEWRSLREGDRIRIGTVDFTWHPPRTEAPSVMHGTIAFAQWQQMNPELFQARQFLISHYLDGAPADRLEIPGRSAVFLEGAGRFVEGPESGGREIIVWDRNQDTVVNDFLRRVEGELQTHGLTRLDPSSPTFERDLQTALTYFVGRLRAEFRNPGEGSREADARLAAFVRAHPGERVLVGEMLRQRFPFCRHLTLVTQAFLTDLGLRGEAVRMQRGSAMGGAHVWNEVIVGRTRRIVEPTWAFYSDRPGPPEVLLPPGLEAIYTRETRGGRVE